MARKKKKNAQGKTDRKLLLSREAEDELVRKAHATTTMLQCALYCSC